MLYMKQANKEKQLSRLSVDKSLLPRQITVCLSYTRIKANLVLGRCQLSIKEQKPNTKGRVWSSQAPVNTHRIQRSSLPRETANVEQNSLYNFTNPSSIDYQNITINSHTDRKLIDKRRLTRVHAYTLTHTDTEHWDSQTEVYIISLGGQPEQTQSFNFHDSLSERERGRETDEGKKEPINEK